jgi:hypothetical protein
MLQAKETAERAGTQDKNRTRQLQAAAAYGNHRADQSPGQSLGQPTSQVMDFTKTPFFRKNRNYCNPFHLRYCEFLSDIFLSLNVCYAYPFSIYQSPTSVGHLYINKRSHSHSVCSLSCDKSIPSSKVSSPESQSSVAQIIPPFHKNSYSEIPYLVQNVLHLDHSVL